jgi:hypothetical protein|tara:strand:+ start:331 stop:1191 length:861 start_codon:yes stop_codon:yes gene_type:complete
MEDGYKMASLAAEHLSEAAYGRYGDTDIAVSRYVDPGKKWHVNPMEKSLMESGARGEKLVDALGSGTINPMTGNEEKFLGISTAAWVAGATIGSFLLSAASSASEGHTAERESSSKVAGYDEALSGIESAQKKLEPARSAKIKLAKAEYEQEAKSFSAETGMKYDDVQRDTEQTIAKANMPTHGTVGAKRSSAWKRIQGTATRGKEKLHGLLGKSMGEIEEWYEGEKGRLDLEQKRITRERELEADKADDWYLGKYAIKAGEFISGGGIQQSIEETSEAYVEHKYG